MDEILRAVAVVVSEGDKVLLVRHGEKAGHLTDVYGLPAGRFQENESAKEAAVRELFEETGLQTTPEQLTTYQNNTYTGTFPRKDGSIVTSTMEVFVCLGYAGELQSSEETIPEWVNLEKITSLNLLPNVKKAIDDAIHRE